MTVFRHKVRASHRLMISGPQDSKLIVSEKDPIHPVDELTQGAVDVLPGRLTSQNADIDGYNDNLRKPQSAETGTDHTGSASRAVVRLVVGRPGTRSVD